MRDGIDLLAAFSWKQVLQNWVHLRVAGGQSAEHSNSRREVIGNHRLDHVLRYLLALNQDDGLRRVLAIKLFDWQECQICQQRAEKRRNQDRSCPPAKHRQIVVHV